jgi:hypothetical protein
MIAEKTNEERRRLKLPLIQTSVNGIMKSIIVTGKINLTNFLL